MANTADKKMVKALRRELRVAYAGIYLAAAECDRRGHGDYDQASQAIGRYDGLKAAYCIVTGKDESTVANEVVSWYISSDYYTPSA